MQPPVALEAISDTAQTRVVLWQSGKLCSVPATGLGAIGAIISLSPDDGAFIVGDGSTWVAESGSTARDSLGASSGLWPVSLGGTGASSASGARSNLGLGTISTQAANNVDINGGEIDNTAIGANTRSSGQFTTGNFNGTVDIGSFDSGGAGNGKQFQSGGNFRLVSSVASGGSVQHMAFFNTNGGVGNINTNGTSTNYVTSSDGRLKSEHTDFDPGPIIDQIEVTEHTREDGTRQRSFASAQAMYAVWPEAVTRGNGSPGDDDFEPWGIDYSKVTPLAILEIKKMRARERQCDLVISDLLNRVKALENASASR